MPALHTRLCGALLLALTLAAGATGCDQTPISSRLPRPSQPPGPVFEQMTAMPSVIQANGAMTLTVSASDRDKKALTYKWTATAGTLSSTTGKTVTWKPTKSDGTLDTPGFAQVRVEISNGKETASGGILLRVTPTGAMIVTPGSLPETTPSASPSPSPSASGSPVPSPSGSPAGCTVGQVTPSLVGIGTVFMVAGTGLSGDAKVTVGGVDAEMLEATATRLTARMPDGFLPGQTLPVQVVSCGKTFDATGTLTLHDNADFDGNVTAAGQGLVASVYAVDADTAAPPTDLDKRKPLGSFLASNLDVPSTIFRGSFPQDGGAIHQWFVVRYDGTLDVPAAGSTTFSLVSEGPARLLVDGSPVVEAPQGSVRGVDGDVTLKAGQHTIRVEYLHGAGNQIGLQLYWTTPGAAEAIVPAGAFSPVK